MSAARRASASRSCRSRCSSSRADSALVTRRAKGPVVERKPHARGREHDHGGGKRQAFAPAPLLAHAASSARDPPPTNVPIRDVRRETAALRRSESPRGRCGFVRYLERNCSRTTPCNSPRANASTRSCSTARMRSAHCVVGDAQLVQPFGLGLGQLAEEVVADRLDGTSQSSCSCWRRTAAFRAEHPRYVKSHGSKPFTPPPAHRRTHDFQPRADSARADRQGIRAEAEACGQLAAVVDLHALERAGVSARVMPSSSSRRATRVSVSSARSSGVRQFLRAK